MSAPLKRTWFASDLHLDANHPEITSEFIALLRACDETTDALYLLGDIFEVWIGDDEDTPFHREVIAALKETTARGIPVYLMHGNRDFLLGKTFLQQTGCVLLPDETRISLYGAPVLLMHGDTLCTADKAYLRARKLTHCRFIQHLFLWLPLSLRTKIAARARAASLKHTRQTESHIMDVTPEEVTRQLTRHQVQKIIHGHTHRPALLDNRIVLSAWHHGGEIVEWRADGVIANLRVAELNSHSRS